MDGPITRQAIATASPKATAAAMAAAISSRPGERLPENMGVTKMKDMMAVCHAGGRQQVDARSCSGWLVPVWLVPVWLVWGWLVWVWLVWLMPFAGPNLMELMRALAEQHWPQRLIAAWL